MSGYAKMKTKSETKLRSMDFSSNLLSLSSSPSELRNLKPEISKTNLEQKQIKKNPITSTAAAAVNSGNKTQDSFSFLEQEHGKEEDHPGCNINYYYYNNNFSNNGENFGSHVIKLKRNSTVSASSVTSHAFQSAVKRAFSMRRSSSVSESYRRIHDQSVTVASPFEDEDLAVKKKKNRKSKIIKACKKLFGL